MSELHSHPEDASISRLSEKLNEHIETRVEYLRLTFIEKIAFAYARHISDGLVLKIFMFFLFFVSVSAAIWLGKYYEDYAAGFAVVGAIYLVLFLLYLALRKSVIDRKLVDKVIVTLCKEEENDDDDEEA